MCNFRNLRADEIECRVQSAKQNGLALLLYKDARVDMNILDEAVGSSNWQREHYECKGNLFCRVGIRCDQVKYREANGDTGIAPDWVWKSDCGTESNTEAQKGEASDSFKRACFNWGIGRELYTAPFIWVSADKCTIKESKDGRGQARYACYDDFIVESITIEDKRITGLAIFNQTKKCIAFAFGKNKDKSGNNFENRQNLNSPEQKPIPEPMTYDKALVYVYKEGKYPEKTLAEIYKTDINYINELKNSEATPAEVRSAILIINEKIQEAKAKKATA